VVGQRSTHFCPACQKENSAESGLNDTLIKMHKKTL
jgi:hypothetical protein